MKKSLIRNFLFCILFISSIFSQTINLSKTFDYSEFDQLLKKHVKNNCVDYTSLSLEKKKLVEFTDKLGEISPDSNPEYFPNDNSKLSYWINAYNAFILLTIIENYPVESIKDINFIGVTIWLENNLLGGEEISFKSLEDDIIRDRFNDPRIHFAINCASVSCPPLLNEVYIPGKLEDQLNHSTIKFINDKTNFKVDEKNKRIYISAIFDWYEDDFINWLKQSKNSDDPEILDYIRMYYKGDFRSEWYNFEIDINDYDWSLNDCDETN